VDRLLRRRPFNIGVSDYNFQCFAEAEKDPPNTKQTNNFDCILSFLNIGGSREKLYIQDQYQ